MSRRFFVETPIQGSTATLADAEAHHLIHVLRAGIGTEVTLFDGRGDEFQATVTNLGRSTVELAVVSRHSADRELQRRIHLAVALPKGDRQKWLVEKCVELGVHALTPLATHRSVAQPTGKALQRLQRAVIEASKQCGRNRLMQIGQPISFAQLVGSSADDAPPGQGRTAQETVRWIADPSGAAISEASAAAGTSQLYALVGPEGGFTDEEVAAALGCGWSAVSLGSRILRIETAALLIAARCQS